MTKKPQQTQPPKTFAQQQFHWIFSNKAFLPGQSVGQSQLNVDIDGLIDEMSPSEKLADVAAMTPSASRTQGRLSAGRFGAITRSVEVEMSIAENKDLLARYITEVWDEANLDAIRKS